VHRLLILLLTVSLVIATAAPTAQTQSRLGLLIGNQAYTGKVQPLKNPHTDINRVAGLNKKIAA
jgi:hypothetical protein